MKSYQSKNWEEWRKDSDSSRKSSDEYLIDSKNSSFGEKSSATFSMC